MSSLGMLEKTVALDRAVDFVTKIDNRKYPTEEFLRSGKTLLGLQRGLKFEQLVTYFEDHESPQEELTPEDFNKYGLKQAAEQQQKTVEEAMATLERMESEGKVVDTEFGSIVLNVNGELKVGVSAAYVRHDGILNITPGKSFALTLKEGKFDEDTLRERLGDAFQGKIIRGQIWIYNDEGGELKLSQDDIIEAVSSEVVETEQRNFNWLFENKDKDWCLFTNFVYLGDKDKNLKTTNLRGLPFPQTGKAEVEVTSSGSYDNDFSRKGYTAWDDKTKRTFSRVTMDTGEEALVIPVKTTHALNEKKISLLFAEVSKTIQARGSARGASYTSVDYEILSEREIQELSSGGEVRL